MTFLWPDALAGLLVAAVLAGGYARAAFRSSTEPVAYSQTPLLAAAAAAGCRVCRHVPAALFLLAPAPLLLPPAPPHHRGQARCRGLRARPAAFHAGGGGHLRQLCERGCPADNRARPPPGRHHEPEHATAHTTGRWARGRRAPAHRRGGRGRGGHTVPRAAGGRDPSFRWAGQRRDPPVRGGTAGPRTWRARLHRRDGHRRGPDAVSQRLLGRVGRTHAACDGG